MGLFSKKPPCPICGGKISWILPWKIEEEYVCSTCYSKIDMESHKANHLTMEEFREYLVFYEQNQLLKDQFHISQQIDFGFWDAKIIFDYQNKLFCMSKSPDKTIFGAGQLKSFRIKEDSTLLVEGSSEGIRRYTSTVPEQAMAMAPQITQIMISRQMARIMDKLDDGKENRSVSMPFFNVLEPFQAFNVELHFDHPYWTVIQCDMEGPRFDNNRPDVNDYLHSYAQSLEEIEKLVAAFKTVAFPGAPEQFIAFESDRAQGVHIGAAPSVDAMEAIKDIKPSLKKASFLSRSLRQRKVSYLEYRGKRHK